MALAKIDYAAAEAAAERVEKLAKDLDFTTEELEKDIQQCIEKGIQTNWARDFIKEYKKFRAEKIGKTIDDIINTVENIKSSINDYKMYSEE